MAFPVRAGPRFGLRGRLLLLVAAVIAPFAAYQSWELYQKRERRIAEAIEQSRDFAESGAERYRDIIDDARNTLELMSHVPAAVDAGPEECGAFLETIRRSRPWSSALFRVEGDGRISCSTVEGAVGLDVSGRPWHRQAVALRAFSVSAFYVTLVRKAPAAAAALPLPALGGGPPRVLMANFDLGWLDRLAATLGEQRGAVVLLVDGDGRALARYPRQDGLAGADLSTLGHVAAALAVDEGSLSGAEGDGTQRFYSFVRLPGTDARLIVGLDRNGVLAPIDATITRAALLFAAVTILMAAAIWLTGRRIFVAPLQAMTETLATTLEFMDQGIMMVDSGGRVQVANARAAALLDLPPEFLAAKPSFRDIRRRQVAAGEYDSADPALRAWVASDEMMPFQRSYERARPNGTVLEVRTAQIPDGSIVRTYADITHLKLAEQRLRESVALYRLLADNASDVIMVGAVPWTGRRSYVSPSCRAVLGYEPDALAAISAHDLIHPDDLAKLTRVYQALSAAHPSATSIHRLRRRDGSWLWVETAFTWLESEDAGDPQILGAIRDIDERMAAEQAVRESEQRYRLLAENTSELIILGHDDGRRSYVSPAVERLLGITPEAFEAMSLRDYVHPDDLGDLFAATSRLSQGEAQVSSLYRGRHASRGWIWIEGVFRRVPDAHGDEPTIVATFRDVSERQAQSEALRQAKEDAESAQALAESAKALAESAKALAEQASEAKTDFLAVMSHEIRTPLNAVIGFTDLLAESGRLPPELRRHAELARSSGQALLTIVDDILDFAKVEAGAIELDRASFHLGALVDNCVSIVRGGAAEKALRVTTAIDPALPEHLVGDASRLRQILLNLLNNAVKFTAAGSVSVGVRGEGSDASGERLRISVTDTGIGIPADKQSRLFERFSQVDGTIRRDFGGTGLGLAICKRLVALMGGEIGAISEAGAGSTFWLTLILPRGAAPVFAPLARAGAASRRGRLLLVEDVPINQELARLVLEAAGHTVTVVSEGAAAVAAVAAGGHDLVLMDVQMPGMDGLTATALIRGLDGPERTIPVIAMTANVLPDEIRRFRQAGMDDHVGKPFDRATLHETIERWLSGPSADAGGGGPAAPAPTSIDRAAFDEIVEALNPSVAIRLLHQLAEQMSHGFDGATDDSEVRDGIRREAHKLVSSAGMLGFIGLSRACAALEQSDEAQADSDGGAAFAAALDRVTALRVTAGTDIVALVASLRLGEEGAAP